MVPVCPYILHISHVPFLRIEDISPFLVKQTLCQDRPALPARVPFLFSHRTSWQYSQLAKIIPFRSIDIFENAVSAGTGNFLVDGPKETVCIDESILPEDTTFGVRISGDSMEPEFHDGQIAWVLQQESVANGEIGIFALNGEAYIKKLQNDKDGIFLISLNEKYAPIKVSENDRLDIFGKVLGKSDASAITGHCR